MVEPEKKAGLAALVIAAKPKAKGDDAAEEKSDGNGFDVAAGEAFAAVKKDDPKAFAKALRNAFKIHCAEDDE